MGTRKSMFLPIVGSLIFLIVIIYLFTSLKQSEVNCSQMYSFDDGIKLNEEVYTQFDGKKIDEILVTKTIYLPERYRSDIQKENIKLSFTRTLDYLGDKVNYTFMDDSIIVKINIKKNELVLLSNIDFKIDNGLKVNINSNTKSSDVILLKVGDIYTDGEFMKKMKKNGYICQ